MPRCVSTGSAIYVPAPFISSFPFSPSRQEGAETSINDASAPSLSSTKPFPASLMCLLSGEARHETAINDLYHRVYSSQRQNHHIRKWSTGIGPWLAGEYVAHL